MGYLISIIWALSCMLLVVLGIAHFILYYKDLMWKHENYLWEYLDKKYDLILVEKRNDE